MSPIVKRLTFFACAVVLITSNARAESKARVHLGDVVVLPGETTQVPVRLQANGEQIVATENETTLPTRFSFVRAEVGPAAKSISASVKAELVPAGAGLEQRKLWVKIQGPSGQFLPDGVIGLLEFKVANEIPEQSFPVYLNVENKAFVTNAQNERLPAGGNKAVVTLMKEPPPVTACFFYMH